MTVFISFNIRKNYLDRKAPDFESKMHDALLVYKQVEMQFGENGGVIVLDDGHMAYTISVYRTGESAVLELHFITVFGPGNSWSGG